MRKWLSAAFIAAMFLGFTGCSNDPKEEIYGGDKDIKFLRNIDLSAHQPNDGSSAKLQKILFYNGKIYAALQYLDEIWQPTANSKILEIDAATENVLREFTSNFKNVVDIKIQNGNLFVADMGDYSAIDGGITKINLSSGTATTILDGSIVGADPNNIEIISETEAFVSMYKNWGDEPIGKINLSTGAFEFVSALSAKNPASAISYNSYSNSLWIGSGTNVSKYSVSNQIIEFEATTALPITEIKSVGATTLTVESDYIAGKYGLVSGNTYKSKLDVGNDAAVGFADGNFFILERPFDGAQKMKFLTADGEIIKELNFETPTFNAHGVCGNGNGKIFVGSYGDLLISVFETK